MSVFLTSTGRAGMRALSEQGIFAADCHAQLHGILLRRLGPEHAALLAEPQHDPSGSAVDWYAEGNGPAIPLRDLPPEEAERIRARAESLAGDINGLADRLTEEGSVLQGRLIQLAVRHPGGDDLWAVDGHPVRVGWGFAPAGEGAMPQDLVRAGAMPVPEPVAAPPPPAATAAAAPAAERRTFLWRPGCLLPLLLLLLLLWLLAALLGLLPFPLPAGCLRDAASRADLARMEAERAALEEELGRLHAELEGRAAMCRPEPKPRPEPGTPKPETALPFFGMAPEPAPEPRPEPKPAPRPEPKPEPRPKPRRGDDLKVPDDARKRNDLSFLEGCWTSETGLVSSRTNEPVIVEYCFDGKGRGRRFEYERRGQRCAGSARAKFRGDLLEITADRAACPDGNFYVPQQVECRGRGGSTQCRGVEMSRDRTVWQARFRRK